MNEIPCDNDHFWPKDLLVLGRHSSHEIPLKLCCTRVAENIFLLTLVLCFQLIKY